MKGLSILALLILILSTSTFGQGGEVDYRVKVNQLAYPRFAQSAEYVRGWLMQFREVTGLLAVNASLEEVRRQGFFYVNKLPQDTTIVFTLPTVKLSDYQCLNWDIQYLGFSNHMKTIMGYGLASRAAMFGMRVENMKLRGAPADSLDSARLNYGKAKQELEEFLSTQNWAD